MLIRTNDRAKFLEALLNVWLKDTTVYCNNCGIVVSEHTKMPCCEDPQVGTNFDVCNAIIAQNKEFKKSRENEFGSNKAKNLRWGVSLPPTLYSFWDKTLKQLYNERLFNEKYSQNWLAKKFKAFAIPEKI